MKTIIIFLLISPLIALGQIDYRQKMDYISTKDSVLRIDWLLRSPEKCQIDFNHYVKFFNTIDNEDYGSIVLVELYHNDKFVRNYEFRAGDDYTNRIYLHNPLSLKKGDNVYFIFKLKGLADNEEYVFNIYQDKNEWVKTQLVVANSVTVVKKQEPLKSTKLKNNGFDRKYYRNLRKPNSIGKEF